MSSTNPLPFEDYPQPEWNSASSVSDALAYADSAQSKEQSSKAYELLLHALGNDHAGTYYPAALPVLSSLEVILHNGSPWSQHAALNVLLELTGSFEPELGYENFAGAPLVKSIFAKVVNMAPAIQNIAQGSSIASASATELLEQIREQQ
jgi:hypothetical protein